MNYSHQTNMVADGTYPVTPPVAKVSVVVCAYNEEAFIERTLQDIRSQNIIAQYPEMFEVIVVDNESVDHTAEIASQYADLVIAAPRGKLNAKRKGIETASGEIIVFLDADCAVGPNLLNLLLRHFHEEEVVAVSGGIQHNTKNIGIKVMDVYGNMINSTLRLQFNGGVSAVRKGVFEAIGGFRDVDQFNRFEVQEEEELAFMRRLHQYGKVVVDTEANIIGEPRYQYCAIHGENCATATEPECQYCREMAARQRF